jgi:hypothetical protein
MASYIRRGCLSLRYRITLRCLVSISEKKLRKIRQERNEKIKKNYERNKRSKEATGSEELNQKECFKNKS